MNKMAAVLYDYQNDALHRMKNGCILNGGTGSGKSRTAVCYYYLQNGGRPYYMKRDDNGSYTDKYYRYTDNLHVDNPIFIPMRSNPLKLYIITTAMKRDSKEWEGELVPFYIDPKDVVIDSWQNIAKYVDISGAFFIFDEQRAINYGLWGKSFIKITKHNKWILLSATPGDNYMDYLPVFIANGFFRNKTDFVVNHVVYSRFKNYPKIDRFINTDKLERFKDQVLVDMSFDRHTVQHHLDIIVGYNPALYNTIAKDYWNPFKEKPIENASEYCYTLRRAINSDPSRLEAVLDIARDKPRLIIFYSFDYELELLRDTLKGEFNVLERNGHKHDRVPKGTDAKWIYLVEYASGSEAWNCIDTDTIVFYSQSYSYKTMVQASGRIDRLNTPFTDLYYYHFISESKIDNDIKKSLKKKKKFNEKKWVEKERLNYGR